LEQANNNKPSKQPSKQTNKQTNTPYLFYFKALAASMCFTRLLFESRVMHNKNTTMGHLK